MERLHKFLARAGVDSRRACEELMLAGRVTVNGRIVRELGSQIDPDKDDIRVDGAEVKAPTELHYVMINKPQGVITSMNDPEGRMTVADLVQTPNRLFPVGRLDFDSEGLLLMTDDGDLTFKLTHPSFEVEKEYHALIDQTPTVEQLRQWREGVELEDGTTAPAWVEVLNTEADGTTWMRVVIHEGRNRQIRRVAEALGLNVVRLIRLREGPLVLEGLKPGEWRSLTETEIQKLRLHAKGSKGWLPQRPLPESPQDEDPYKRPRRVRRIERPGGQFGGRPVRFRAELGADEPRVHANLASDTDDSPRQPRFERDNRDDRQGPTREGGRFERDDRRGPPREGGRFERDNRQGPPREGGRFERDNRQGPPREGGRFERDDRGGPPREGGRFERDDRRGPPREGGRFERDNRQGPPREQGLERQRGPLRPRGAPSNEQAPGGEANDGRRPLRRRGGEDTDTGTPTE